MSDFGEGKTVKTRAQHRCSWCGQKIDVGVDAYNYRGNYDGEWQNWYMHNECLEDYETTGEPEFMPYDNERPVVSEMSK